MLVIGAASDSRAEDLTAAVMLERMSDREQYAYISGVVAGLATARFVDAGDAASACIDRWFAGPGIRDTLYRAFERFGDKSPSAIIYALAAKECDR